MDDPIQNEPPRQPDGWELVCAGVLSTEFGRRPSEAVANAVMQLATEEAEPVAVRQGIRDWWRSLRLMPRLVLSGGCALVVIFLAISSWLIFGDRSPVHTFCTVTAELNSQWANVSRQLEKGDTLAGGTWQLSSGVVELTFASKARVAVEGPARFTIVDDNSMELAYGKLSTDVPKPAHGFAVKTPAATVVDLGTRFGLNVSSDDSIKVEVFEGKVRLLTNSVEDVPGRLMELAQNGVVTLTADGRLTRSRGISESDFPRLSTTVVIHPANCGFDGDGKMFLGDVPTNFGYWSGPSFELAPATQEVAPVEGRGMLHFLPPASGNDSVVWQAIPLRKYRSMLTNSDLQMGSFAWFNRARGGVNNVKHVGLSVAAYHGDLQNVHDLWTRRHELALAVAEKELDIDNDPATWQKINISTALPPDADFLIISMHAVAPDNADPATAFSGDFADLVDCSVYTPLQPSSANR